MRRRPWRKNCKEFQKVREMIENETSNSDILVALLDVSNIFAKDDKEPFQDDFIDLSDEIENLLSDSAEDLEGIDFDTVNYYLGEFYDLCDNARIWLTL